MGVRAVKNCPDLFFDARISPQAPHSATVVTKKFYDASKKCVRRRKRLFMSDESLESNFLNILRPNLRISKSWGGRRWKFFVLENTNFRSILRQVFVAIPNLKKKTKTVFIFRFSFRRLRIDFGGVGAMGAKTAGFLTAKPLPVF